MSADPNVFFSEKNENKLETFVCQQFPDADGKDRVRIGKTIRHYMNEVYEKNRGLALQELNKEVANITMVDYRRFIGKQRQEFDKSLMEDTSQRYERLQNERKVSKKSMPDPPDFRISITEDGPPASEIFERMKMERENEINASDLFLKNEDESNKFINTSLSSRMQQDEENKKFPIFARQPIIPTFPEANPTIIPVINQSIRAEDFIIKQDDVITYKENEYNLFIYSADRNWTRDNGSENRYNFTVNFDPAGNQQGFNINPAAQIKFKNISRIELVKAILPTEGLDTLYKSTIDTNINTLSFPYIILRVPELENNNYGTDNNLDRAFGVLQYDAIWNSDSNMARKSGGYLAMIPKFMKCQKVYHPTPLATLQRLTVQVQRPDGSQLSQTQDVYNISQIYGSGNIYNPRGTDIYKDTSENFTNQNGFGYIWIQTSNWFNQYSMGESERVVLSNVAFTDKNFTSPASTDFTTFIQRPEGHLIVGTGITNGSNGLYGSTNTLGYMNTFIIPTKYNDPTTGSTTPNYFGGTFSNTSTMFSANMGGKVLNLNHQTQYVFRVITRDLDSSSRIRPDNL